MSFGPLTSTDWLAAHLDAVRVVDVRWYLDGRSGREAYERGHVPGAVWLDLDTDLSDPPSRSAGRHPLPSPERFAAALGRVGIGPGELVVAYDDAGGSTAARLWWLLRVLGEPVAVLDGGIAAWSGPLTRELPLVTPIERPTRGWPPERFVGADELGDLQAVVYDARTSQRYAHGDAAIDPRPGHIPGALSAPWGGNLDADSRFRPAAELQERFAAARSGRAIAYCGSGVSACHDLLAMELAGIEHTALYPGSWSQWGADAARAVTQGLSP